MDQIQTACMIPFKSIIVFDSETTSMPNLDHNTTKIVELAFLGCEIEHIKLSFNIPRVLHKLVLCLNPRKMIHPNASETSGLENELLKNLQPFRLEDVDMLKHFISRLPPPVCMVAHNGHKFDFPILQKALRALNQTLPNNVYCADSLEGFRFIYPTAKSRNFNFQRGKQMIQESTPKSQKTIPANTINYKYREQELDTHIIRPEVCRELFPEDVNRSQSLDKSPKSHKLSDIYYFLFKRNFPNAHRAEEDCKALLSCIIKCEEFLDWMNRNGVIFNTIEPLF